MYNISTFKLKIFIFFPTPKVYYKHRLDEEMKTLYKTIKLKGYFKDLNENALLTEEQIFKLTNHKKLPPNKINYRVLTCIEATQEELECKMENQKPQRFKNLTKGERKALQGFSERDGNVILKADKGGIVVILDKRLYQKSSPS